MEEQKSVINPQVAVSPSVKSIRPNLTSLYVILGVVVAVALGVLTGWFFTSRDSGSVQSTTSTKVSEVVKTNSGGSPVEAGLKDETGDNAEGVLTEGGIGGEGTHHLVRDGGASRYVYLTSSIINPSDFVGKKVKVWGSTVSARKAGWLLDVSRIRVIE